MHAGGASRKGTLFSAYKNPAQLPALETLGIGPLDLFACDPRPMTHPV